MQLGDLALQLALLRLGFLDEGSELLDRGDDILLRALSRWNSGMLPRVPGLYSEG